MVAGSILSTCLGAYISVLRFFHDSITAVQNAVGKLYMYVAGLSSFYDCKI